MFGVSQETYQQERDARIRAEAHAESWRLQVERLTEELKEERKLVKELIERALPKSEQPPVQAFTGRGQQFLSYAEIMKMPAIGRRGMRERNTMAAEAKVREEQEEQQGRVEERKATLTPEEEALLEQTIEK